MTYSVKIKILGFFAILMFVSCGVEGKKQIISSKYKYNLPKEIPVIPQKLQLTLLDDFDGVRLNNKVWGRFDRAKSAPWSRYICDTISNLVEVSDGSLKIRAVWDNKLNHPWTGCVQTRHKRTLKYGRIDVRAKFTRGGHGGWPAIWMLAQNPIYEVWPNLGEIDIMEQIDNDPMVHQTIHQADPSGLGKDIDDHKDFRTPIDLSEYHVYTLVKTPYCIGLYVDYKLRGYHNPTIGGADKYWPFETDFYLILNYACSDMGQYERGFWSKRMTPEVIKENKMPYEMEVDYVKFYE